MFCGTPGRLRCMLRARPLATPKPSMGRRVMPNPDATRLQAPALAPFLSARAPLALTLLTRLRFSHACASLALALPSRVRFTCACAVLALARFWRLRPHGAFADLARGLPPRVREIHALSPSGALAFALSSALAFASFWRSRPSRSVALWALSGAPGGIWFLGACALWRLSCLRSLALLSLRSLAL